MIDFKGAGYTYPLSPVPALSDITCSIGEGIHLLLGENGAGKTTLLHLAATLLWPTTGEVTVMGKDSRLRLPSTLRSLFFVADNEELPADTIADMARLHGSVFYPRFDADMLADNLKAFGLDPRTPLDAMSLGQRRKAIVAYALALRADILLLDEPANGFDIGSRDILRSMMARCVEPGQTVIISTHTTADLQPLYDGIIMLRRGRLLFAMTTAELSSRLAFGVHDIPPRDALFTMSDIGRFRSIRPAASADDLTEIDIHLLYSSLQSPEADTILRHLSRQ